MVNLSQAFFGEKNTAALAVEAHDCVHAVQHNVGNKWLEMRSVVVPIDLFNTTTLLTFIILPVKCDGAKRALAWMKEKQIVTSSEYDASKDALRWAARTYVVSAVGLIATLLYYLPIYHSRHYKYLTP
ncbi:MAG: Zn-dependent membrane protease YugP [Flavobacteriales bacterium]|jgi:Zn-dependent membrane protease YugP